MRRQKKPRSYSDYTLENLQTICGIDNRKLSLNLAETTIEPSDWLKQNLAMSKLIPLNTEKAKSEYLIAPILLELKSQFPNRFNYFSGNTFDVDPAKSLKGRCDFLLTKNLSLNITAPVIAIFEAKDDNLDRWLGQCGAEMVAARIFNQIKQEPIEIIHGAVTNGYEWLFLRLEGEMLLIDTKRYSLENLPKLLGVLERLIFYYGLHS
jgi:hypothetical protein